MCDGAHGPQYPLEASRYLLPPGARYVAPASCSGSAEMLDWPASGSSMSSVAAAAEAGRAQAAAAAYEAYYRQAGYYLVTAAPLPPHAQQQQTPEPIYYQLQPPAPPKVDTTFCATQSQGSNSLF